jgi:hypothetical protein
VALDDVQIAQHVRLAVWLPDEVPAMRYPYRGDYEESLAAGTYISYSDSLLSDRSAVAIDAAPPLVPRYLPRGSAIRRAEEPASVGFHSVYWTPMGELSLFESLERRGRIGLQTIVGEGREIKIVRFVVRNTEVTLMSEGLPWPELDRIRKGLVSEPF